MLTFKDPEIRSKIRSDLGGAAGDAADGVAFLPFDDMEESVRADVRAVKGSALVGGATAVHGFVYDVKTGRLSPVAE